ncbi:ATP-grasp fold amidoligase family protein [Peribacillus frigoritolerans]|uniref:ATP-grasp fold amidoligase family protein n=1 Tax=Peribacillus frigoritolerans TaxID=450367 RepID=UPI002162A161|nr:ATP-grasp fold amidoligase family protein [Peribacillus frigoritolerans]
MVKKIIKVIRDPKIAVFYILNSKISRLIPDAYFLKIPYKIRTGKKLDLKNPVSFNEKIQWLKINNRNPKYTNMVDKYEVRKYISNTIGEEYLNPLLGVWDKFEDINFEALPNQFVLKCTHDSGRLLICKDKSKFNLAEAKKKINNSLKQNYYYSGREWPYKNVKPRIICEKYMEQDDGDELRDYRFFCFNGEPKFIAVDFSITNKKKTRRNLYDLNWNLMDGEISYPKELSLRVEKPDKLDLMIALSRKVSKDIPHARVDFYYINQKIIFGEITFFHQSGMGKIRPIEFEEQMGNWLKLPQKRN